MNGRDTLLTAAVAAVEAAGLSGVADVLDGGGYVEVAVPGTVGDLARLLPAHGLSAAEEWTTGGVAVVLAVVADGAAGIEVCGAGPGRSRGPVGFAGAPDPPAPGRLVSPAGGA